MELLSSCPNQVQIAFVNALQLVTQSGLGNAKLASTLLSDFECSEAPADQATSIVHLQTLILLLVDADWRSAPSVLSLFGRALALAQRMRLWQSTSIGISSDADSDASLSSRIWFTLVVIDRWISVGSGKPVQIPDASVVVPAELSSLTGESLYYMLSRYSIQSRRLSANQLLHRTIQGARKDLPGHLDPPPWYHHHHCANGRDYHGLC